MVLHVGTGGRPGANVACDVVHGYLLLDHEIGGGKFGEWEFNRPVTLFGEPPFRGPEGPDDVAVEVLYDRVDLRRDLEQAVRPDRDQSTRSQHAPPLDPQARAIA